MPSRARGTFVSCANKPAGPASPSRPAVRRPTRPARGMSGFWTRQGDSCFWRHVQETCLGEYVGRLVAGRIVLSAFRFAGPRLTAPPCASPRPARGMSEFWIRKVFRSLVLYMCVRKSKLYFSLNKTACYFCSRKNKKLLPILNASRMLCSNQLYGILLKLLNFQ